MNSAVNTKFAVKPVAAALALALSAATAYAAPTPNQMPGRGIVSALSIAGAVQVNGGGSIPVGTAILGLTNGSRIDIVDKVVLSWGSTLAPVDPINPSGFNLGSNATLFFGASTVSTTTPAILNVDVSGNNSQIYGNLISTNVAWAGCPICTIAPAIFVSNANGIVMAPGARIVAPTGVGLIGANLNSALQFNEFVGNNNWNTPNPPAYGHSYVDVTGGQSQVDIGGFINGDFALNTPAQYIFVAGGNVNVQNTGNLYAYKVVVDAGMIATATKASVAGVTNQTVNRLWDVEAGLEQACCFVGPLAGNLQIGAAGSNFLNLGSVSSKMGGPNLAYITVQASGNIRSGTLGDTNNQVGFFADDGIFLDSYSNTSKVEVYNVVSGYSTNRVLPFLDINKYAYYSTPFFSPDVTVQAILPGAGQPSTISTTQNVSIFGGNIAINSTINHRNAAAVRISK